MTRSFQRTSKKKIKSFSLTLGLSSSPETLNRDGREKGARIHEEEVSSGPSRRTEPLETLDEAAYFVISLSGHLAARTSRRTEQKYMHTYVSTLAVERPLKQTAGGDTYLQTFDRLSRRLANR
ncbi:unnamed protein product [Cochlearia groenlandica]